VDRVHASGVPIVRVAEKPGLQETVLRRWIGRFGGETAAHSSRRSTSVPSTPSPAELAAGNARLKRELHRAGMEQDILEKKASLIF
jgi:transposase